MFNIFGKKGKKEEENASSATNSEDDNGEEKKEATTSVSESLTGNSADITRLATEIDRLKAGAESFGEVRKAFNERFERITEQIGELRAMIMDRDRIVQTIELKAVKASDLVESIQPEKLSTEIQKQDAKIEALKANLEGNEAMMDRLMEELKEARRKLEFFRGIEEIVKLSEEVKKELIEIKKVEASIHIDTDKNQTIYAEIRKKFQDIDIFKDSLRELQVGSQQSMKDIDFLKGKITGLADKSELDSLVQKVQRYIDSLKEIEKKSSLTQDIEKLKVLMEGIKS
ncbi:MAG: hypothetical protein ACP5OG_05660 [Candidatus Nanoarchaeia archaeon]